MRKLIAAAAVVAAAAGSLLGFAGHANAQSICVTVSVHIVGAPPLPVAPPVALPIPMNGYTQTECIPPDGVPGVQVPNLPV